MGKEKLLTESLTLEEIAGTDRVLTVDVRTMKNQGNNETEGFTYSVMCRSNIWKRFDVEISGVQRISQEQINANGGHIIVKFDGFEGYVGEDNALFAKATDIEVVPLC